MGSKSTNAEGIGETLGKEGEGRMGLFITEWRFHRINKKDIRHEISKGGLARRQEASKDQLSGVYHICETWMLLGEKSAPEKRSSVGGATVDLQASVCPVWRCQCWSAPVVRTGTWCHRMLPSKEEKAVRPFLWLLHGSEMVTANLQMAVSSVDCRSLCWLAVYYMQLGILLMGKQGTEDRLSGHK